MEKGSIWSADKRKNGEVKRGIYLEKENIRSLETKKNVPGKYFENENMWSAKGKKNGEGYGGLYLKKEKIWSTEEKRIRI